MTKQKKDYKRVVVVSDLHCGHLVGLTPPHFNPVYPRGSPESKLSMKRRGLWKFYADTIESLKPIDVLIVNGDAIDGPGVKSGGTELLTTDRVKQVEMAVDSINEAEAEMTLMSFGTPYHTGKLEDWETEVAKGVNAHKIGGHDWVNVNGVVFDYRHFVSRSVIPHGRFTALAREVLWGILWAEGGQYPRGDIFIRSHVHYHVSCAHGAEWKAFITPALQGPGSKIGIRIASGIVHFGLLSFDVWDDGRVAWQTHILKERTARQHIIKA